MHSVYRHYVILTLFLLSLLLSFCHSKAQSSANRFDHFFDSLYNDHELSGNILVAINDSVIYQHSLGYADVENKIPNSAGSAFQLASLSKVFTAVAILQLKETGKLKLDDAAITYLPSFPFKEITIRQLLSHTSGLGGFEIFESLHRQDTTRIFTSDDIISALKKFDKPLLFSPGKDWNYSNTGFGLLALVVEKVSGMQFGAYLAKHIFLPAGMKHTYIQTSFTNVKDANRTNNYDFQSYAPAALRQVNSFERNIIPHIILGNFIGPGNVVSTTGDLLQFDKALYGRRLLKPSTLLEAFTPVKRSNGDYVVTGWANGKSYYGLGWMILCDTSHGKIVWHSGGAPGMVTALLRNISRHETVVVLDNVTHRGLHGIAVNTMALLDSGNIFFEKKSLAHAYAAALYEKGIDFATVKFNELKTDTAHYFMNEGALNICGLELMWDGYYPLALEALKLNTFLYPNSWNTYDSYAEALWFSGKKEEAIAMYQKSIIMNPDNKSGKDMLQKIMNSPTLKR
jgi:CubicO group peptidase (beta-lactamase class C family)